MEGDGREPTGAWRVEDERGLGGVGNAGGVGGS
jgi:hypothetical protein